MTQCTYTTDYTGPCPRDAVQGGRCAKHQTSNPPQSDELGKLLDKFASDYDMPYKLMNRGDQSPMEQMPLARQQLLAETKAAIIELVRREVVGERDPIPEVPEGDDEELIATDVDLTFAMRIGRRTGVNKLRAQQNAILDEWSGK